MTKEIEPGDRVRCIDNAPQYPLQSVPLTVDKRYKVWEVNRKTIAVVADNRVFTQFSKKRFEFVDAGL